MDASIFSQIASNYIFKKRELDYFRAREFPPRPGGDKVAFAFPGCETSVDLAAEVQRLQRIVADGLKELRSDDPVEIGDWLIWLDETGQVCLRNLCGTLISARSTSRATDAGHTQPRPHGPPAARGEGKRLP